MVRKGGLALMLVALGGIPCEQVWAKPLPPVDAEFDELLSLEIEDLVVTLVAKRTQKLNDVASAVYVITNEDLHRAGITSIPDALRMVLGLDVAQASYQFIL
ncbi:MAG: hypothetical protein SFT92_07825 [Rickettsiales bacterium]|nr:hypothetical protein [Rickettsiales bacterium]